MMGELRVMSYNVKDLTMDRLATARVVRAVGPDVLCLQEVPRRLSGAWRVAAFARECGLHWSGHHRGSGGTTILTSLRVQVHEVGHHRLAVPRWQRTRGYAVARLGLAGQAPMVVASVHLGLDAAEREEHATQILRTVGTGEPVLVAGDLNEDESGASWRHFSSVLRPVSATGPTYPSEAPRVRLDVIFASAGVPAHFGGEVLAREDDLVAASDHRPVWVDVAAR
jgi:endonuclease/exonuclease/phosphatase family metal-dependent hydrolase